MNKKTIKGIIKYWADLRPKSIAVATPGEYFLSYKNLYLEVLEVEKQFRKRGVKKNDRVAIVLCRGFLDILINITVSSNACSVPLSSDNTKAELRYLFEKFKVKALVVDSSVKEDVIDLANELSIIIIMSDYTEKKLVMEFKNDELNLNNLSSGTSTDNVFVLPTSGTTALPKAVSINSSNVYSGAVNIINSLKLTEGDVCLNVMPFFHVHGLMVAVAVIFSGGTVFTTPKFNSKSFFEWLEIVKPSWYTASAALQQLILSELKNQKEVIDKINLRLIRSSSAPLPPETTAGLENNFSAPVIESYGMTEATLQITSQPLSKEKRKLGSVGKASGPKLKVVNKKGEIVPTNGIGEILIKGDNVISSYEEDYEVNQKSFLDGWLRTGDLGYLDEDDFVFIKGRIKEMINKGGENISPREIDEALLKYPGVKEAITFSMPHKTMGEDVAAAVVIDMDNEFSERDIRSFLKEKIAEHKIPTRIICVNELPKTKAGKIKRVGAYEELKDYFNKEGLKPKTDLEKHLAEIWSEVLSVEIEKIGLDDNFFEIGGDSLKIEILAKRCSDEIFEVSSKDIFYNPTIRSLLKVKDK